jgi:hypothetical protein
LIPDRLASSGVSQRGNGPDADLDGSGYDTDEDRAVGALGDVVAVEIESLDF